VTADRQTRAAIALGEPVAVLFPELMHWQVSPAVMEGLWNERFPSQIPERLVMAERLESDTFNLEGHDLVAVEVIRCVDEIEVATFNSGKVWHLTLIDAMGIDDNPAFGGLAEDFGQAHNRADLGEPTELSDGSGATPLTARIRRTSHQGRAVGGAGPSPSTIPSLRAAVAICCRAPSTPRFGIGSDPDSKQMGLSRLGTKSSQTLSGGGEWIRTSSTRAR
jgi:hypothetical protein